MVSGSSNPGNFCKIMGPLLSQSGLFIQANLQLEQGNSKIPLCWSQILKDELKKKEMETPEQQKSRVVVVDSLQSWESYVTQASNMNCPIVVHFTASWCMPSVAMSPLFEELASSYPDVLFLTVDVDEVKEVATRLEIKAMPTFLLLKDGAPVEKLVGANPEEIRKRIEVFVQSIRVSVA